MERGETLQLHNPLPNRFWLADFTTGNAKNTAVRVRQYYDTFLSLCGDVCMKFALNNSIITK